MQVKKIVAIGVSNNCIKDVAVVKAGRGYYVARQVGRNQETGTIVWEATEKSNKSFFYYLYNGNFFTECQKEYLLVPDNI